MPETLKILFLAADPFHDQARLRLEQEVRAIDTVIQRGSARDALDLRPHFDTRTRDLQQALLRHRPQIVHFAGHGHETGVIYLGDEYGQPKAVNREALAGLFGILRGSIRVVVLNACDTLPIVELLGDVVDYAIGMNAPIEDRSSIVFAEAFYGALAHGCTVREAFGLGVNQLQIEELYGAETPVLHVRPGVDADRPLVEPRPADADAARVGTVESVMRLGAVKAQDDLALVAQDGAGPGPSGDVRQEVHADSVEAPNLSIVAYRPGGPPPRS